MTWQVPQSQTGGTINLGTTDDVFVASGVTIGSTSANAILGTGSGHEALIYGTVAGGFDSPLSLGDSPSLDSGEIVTIKPGGQIHGFGAALGIKIFAHDFHIDNQGLISSPTGIFFNAQSANTRSTIKNSGTIEANDAIVVGGASTVTISVFNSGLISGATASFTNQGAPLLKELITNTGLMVGSIFFGSGDDMYNGAQGRVIGTVHGASGADVIIGGNENNFFFGDAGNDVLTGGRGRDTLLGGPDADRFNFDSIKESVKGGNRDQIMHFERGPDHIDLRDIDAKTGVSGNQAFRFIGKQDFHDKKGELRYEDKGSKVIVQGDVNGDGKADFEIYVVAGSLSKGDFLL